MFDPDEFPDGKPSELSEMMTGAVAQHELYSTWVDAGFTQTQALELLKAVIVGMLQAGD